MLASTLHHPLFTEGLSLSSSCWTSCGSFLSRALAFNRLRQLSLTPGLSFCPSTQGIGYQKKVFIFFFQISRHGSRCESEAVIREEEEDGEQVT